MSSQYKETGNLYPGFDQTHI